MSKEVKLLLLGELYSCSPRHVQRRPTPRPRTPHAAQPRPLAPMAETLTYRAPNRSWRVRKVHDSQADEAHLLPRLQQAGEARMEARHLQQHCPVVPHHLRGHDRAELPV